MSRDRQQSLNTSNLDRESLNAQPQNISFPTQYDGLTHSNDITTPNYDTPLTQSLDNNISFNNTESTQSTIQLISSADYALNVIFSQFKHLADAKMSFILNMGVVQISNSEGRKTTFCI
jgi:hypothetical protein